MLSGAPMSREERETSHWLTSHLFGSGLQPLTVDIGDRLDTNFLVFKFILWIILLYCGSFRMSHASAFHLLLFIKIQQQIIFVVVNFNSLLNIYAFDTYYKANM